MRDDIIFQIRLFPSNGCGPEIGGATVVMPREVFDRYLSPKPREHDMPEPFNHLLFPKTEAHQKETDRRQITATIANKLADAILKIIERQDPIKGHSQEVDGRPESA